MKLIITGRVAVLTLLLFIGCLHAQAQSSKTTLQEPKLSVAQKETLKLKKQQAKRLELMTYYGLSASQFEEYQRIQKSKEAKIYAVRAQELTKAVRKPKIDAINSENRAQLKIFFTPKQYALYELRVKKYKVGQANEKACIQSYKAEKRRLAPLPKLERRKATRSLNTQYIQKLSMLMPPAKAKKTILDIDYFDFANNRFIKKQKLSKKQVIALGKVMEERELRLEEAEAQSLSKPEKKKRIQAIRGWEKKRFAEIMGAKIYAGYVSFQNRSRDERYKAKLGFTDADYSTYKRIENNYAIKVMEIKKSSAVQAEKKQKIALARETKIAALREALPASAFEKWYKGEQDKAPKKNT